MCLILGWSVITHSQCLIVWFRALSLLIAKPDSLHMHISGCKSLPSPTKRNRCFTTIMQEIEMSNCPYDKQMDGNYLYVLCVVAKFEVRHRWWSSWPTQGPLYNMSSLLSQNSLALHTFLLLHIQYGTGREGRAMEDIGKRARSFLAQFSSVSEKLPLAPLK